MGGGPIYAVRPRDMRQRYCSIVSTSDKEVFHLRPRFIDDQECLLTSSPVMCHERISPSAPSVDEEGMSLSNDAWRGHPVE